MKRFCSHPFNRAHLSKNGDVYTCCAAWLGLPIGSIFRQSFSKAWNSPAAQKIRASILDESFRYCKEEKCPRMVSGRLEKEAGRADFSHIIQEKRVTLDKGPQLLSLNYDPSCNLHCESCRNRVKVLDKEQEEGLLRFQDSLIASDLFDSVRRLTVSGAGEVFASRVLLSLLAKIKQGEHPGLKITLRTNGLLLTPQNWQRLKNVHYAVDLISISIDAAAEETYARLRRGGDFKKLLENLAFLKEVKKTNPLRVKLNFVVQEANYREMPEFIKLAKRFDCDRVAFAKIFNLDTYQPGEYQKAAVHEPNHPQFKAFTRLINQPIFKDPIVRLRNLAHLVE